MSTNNGWASDALDRARSEAEQKAQGKSARAGSKKEAKGNKPILPQSNPPKGLSASEELLAIVSRNDTVAELRKTLAGSKNLAGSQELVDRFVELVDSVDAYAEYRRSMQEETEDASAWGDLGWPDKEEQLRSWSEEGDDQAQTILAELDKFLEFNVAYKVFLYHLVDRFLGSLAGIATIPGLKRFLDEAYDDRWVNRFRNPRWEDPEGLEIRLRWGQKEERWVYIRLRTEKREEKAPIARAWPYIKKALARITETQQGLDELRSHATPGFSPARISRGEEGILFVQTGAVSAVLLAAESEGGHGMVVKVVGSFGCDESRLPSDAQLWDKKTHRPTGGNTGKWAFITRAIGYHAEKRGSNLNAHGAHRDARISNLVAMASFGTRFEDRGLTKVLIEGHQGIAAWWDNRFGWNQRQEFFGAAISHNDNGTFVLESAVSDHRLPKDLVGQKLPLAVEADKLDVRLQPNLPGMKPEVLQALKMVCTAASKRLRIEAKFSAESPESEGETAS